MLSTHVTLDCDVRNEETLIVIWFRKAVAGAGSEAASAHLHLPATQNP